MPVMGTGIFYTPTPSLHGTDGFGWTVSYPDQAAHDAAEIRIR